MHLGFRGHQSGFIDGSQMELVLNEIVELGAMPRRVAQKRMRPRKRLNATGEGQSKIGRLGVVAKGLRGNRLHRSEHVLNAVIQFPDEKLLCLFGARLRSVTSRICEFNETKCPSAFTSTELYSSQSTTLPFLCMKRIACMLRTCLSASNSAQRQSKAVPSSGCNQPSSAGRLPVASVVDQPNMRSAPFGHTIIRRLLSNCTIARGELSP